jgi:hypothetical protein
MGRCPGCRGSVPIEPYEKVSDRKPAATATQAPVVAREPSVASPRIGGSFSAAGSSFDLESGGIGLQPRQDGETYAVTPPEGDDADYGLLPGETPSSAPIAYPSRDYSAPPKKSRRQKARELADLKAEGKGYLLKIRLLLLGLGVLMIAFNVWAYGGIEGLISEFRSAMAGAPGADPAKVEEVAGKLRVAMTVECGIYLTLGVGLCVLAVFIGWFPRVATIAALGTYVGAWVLDTILLQTLFGPQALGMVLFSTGTLIKVGIISGLWYGVQVGQAYSEQVIQPAQELAGAEDADDGDDEA